MVNVIDREILLCEVETDLFSLSRYPGAHPATYTMGTGSFCRG